MKDYYLFCTSPRDREMHCATIIASKIAQMTGKKQVLCMKKIPWYSTFFDNIDFIEGMPPDVASYGPRGCHVDTVQNDTDTYINTWVNQLRGRFAPSGVFDSNCIKRVTRSCIDNIGQAKWSKVFMSERSIFSSGLPKPSDYEDARYDTWYSPFEKICLFPDAYDSFTSTGICPSTFLSENSTKLFFSPGPRNKAQNCENIEFNDFAGALNVSDIVIAKSAYSTLLFNNFLKNKRIILFEENVIDSSIQCKEKVVFPINSGKDDNRISLNALIRR